MKKCIIFISCFLSILTVFGQKTDNKELLKAEIYKTEKAFEKMTVDKGITEAFYQYADSLAVINRGNDSLIYGRNNIRHYYSTKNNTNATVNWTPDFIQVSDDGTLGYTYGKYVWKAKQPDGTIKEFRGIFHTVWRRQADGSWKYVWD